MRTKTLDCTFSILVFPFTVASMNRHGSTPNIANSNWDLLILYHKCILLFNILDTKSTYLNFRSFISHALLSYKTGFACFNKSNVI